MREKSLVECVNVDGSSVSLSGGVCVRIKSLLNGQMNENNNGLLVGK